MTSNKDNRNYQSSLFNIADLNPVLPRSSLGLFNLKDARTIPGSQSRLRLLLRPDFFKSLSVHRHLSCSLRCLNRKSGARRPRSTTKECLCRLADVDSSYHKLWNLWRPTAKSVSMGRYPSSIFTTVLPLHPFRACLQASYPAPPSLVPLIHNDWSPTPHSSSLSPSPSMASMMASTVNTNSSLRTDPGTEAKVAVDATSLLDVVWTPVIVVAVSRSTFTSSSH